MSPDHALDSSAVLRFADLTVRELARAREEIDALNVYPVPDQDTGTNLFLTWESGRDAVAEALAEPPAAGANAQDPRASPEASLEALARGTLLGARGNAGVILSQLVRAVTGRLHHARSEESLATVFADAMRLAADAGYAAVGAPMEGTMLSVARAASEGAVRAAQTAGARLGTVVQAASRAAQQALARTPEQLAVLREAGVVDAGGRGLCVVLEALETAVTGRRAAQAPPTLGAHAIPVPRVADGLTADGPAYEVMFLLDAEDEAVSGLRRGLQPLGDSLVVVGGQGLWNVHVHVDDVGAALEAGIAAGRPHRIRVTHFAEQTGRRAVATPRGRGVVAVAAGEGLAGLFTEAGAHALRGGPGHRPSTRDFLTAVRDAGALEVVILPNDAASVAAAEAAAREAEQDLGVRVAVVATSAQVQGLAAMAVHEPGRAFDQDVLAMTSAARHARHGAVTIAAQRAMTIAGPCETGDVLGAVEGDFVLVGSTAVEVAAGVVDRLLGGGGEMATVVTGRDGAGLGRECAAYLRTRHPSVETVVYDGGQERYLLLVGVE